MLRERLQSSPYLSRVVSAENLIPLRGESGELLAAEDGDPARASRELSHLRGELVGGPLSELCDEQK